MNSVKYAIVSGIKKELPNLSINVTYGAKTKRTRNDLNIIKSHANDAYCMGEYRPLHRAKTITYQKRRRNNRILEKFYDAKYVDIRDDSVKSGQELSCNKTNRSESRNSIKNERIFRGEKKSTGRRTIRTKRYAIQSGDIILYKGKKYTSGGVHCNGTRNILKETKKSVKISDITVIKYVNGWSKYNPELKKAEKESNKQK